MGRALERDARQVHVTGTPADAGVSDPRVRERCEPTAGCCNARRCGSQTASPLAAPASPTQQSFPQLCFTNHAKKATMHAPIVMRSARNTSGLTVAHPSPPTAAARRIRNGVATAFAHRHTSATCHATTAFAVRAAHSGQAHWRHLNHADRADDRFDDSPHSHRPVASNGSRSSGARVSVERHGRRVGRSLLAQASASTAEALVPEPPVCLRKLLSCGSGAFFAPVPAVGLPPARAAWAAFQDLRVSGPQVGLIPGSSVVDFTGCDRGS